MRFSWKIGDRNYGDDTNSGDTIRNSRDTIRSSGFRAPRLTLFARIPYCVPGISEFLSLFLVLLFTWSPGVVFAQPGGGEPPVQLRNWRALDAGIEGDVRALALFGDDLIAAGSFAVAGGEAASNIARWDGSAWSALGSGINGPVEALVVWNGDLIAAGDFTVAGRSAALNIARWNGDSWSRLGAGMNGVVRALAVHEGSLVAGGDFSASGGNLARHIALWNGSAWNTIGAGFDGPVYALASFQGLVAGGAFTSAGVGPANHIARWDGSSWGPIGGADRPVHALLAKGSRLYVGGDFTVVAGQPSERIARWSGSSWSPVPNGAGGPVYTFALFDGAVAVGGGFDRMAGIPAGNIAIRRGPSWETLRPGMNGRVRALVEYRSGLVAGGLFTTADGKPVEHVGRWACDPPAVPGGIAATGNLCGRVRVSWEDVERESGYRVYRNGALIGEVGAGVTGYDDRGASVGGSRYAVLAWNGCGESARTREVRGSSRRPPGKPGGLVASDTSCTVVRLEWGAVPKVDNYRILRDGGPVVVLPATVTSYEDRPAPGAHGYAVQSGNGCGWSASATATGIAIPPPAPPASIEASDSSCSIVRIDWSPSDGAESYRLYRDGEPIAVVDPSVLSYEDAPAPGAHEYGVAAGDSCGWSAAAVDGGTLLALPDTPSRLTATNNSCSVVRLDWQASTGAAGYRLYREGDRIADLPPTATSYLDTVAAGAYGYALTAGNHCGWSPEAATSGSVLPASPPAPADFAATVGSCEGVTLTWAVSPGAENYDLFRDGTLVAILPGGSVSYYDSPPAGSHDYRLTARNQCGYSGPAEAAGAVLPPNPGPVAELTASDSSCTVIHIEWSAPAGAESCRVSRDGDYLVTLPASEPWFDDTPPPGEHRYEIGAKNKCGWSTNIAAVGRVRPAAPETPSPFLASDGSCSAIDLAWSEVRHAERYILRRDGSPLDTLPPGTGSYRDVVPSGSYAYELIAENGCGASPPLKATGAVHPVPASPASFTASGNSCAHVLLGWSATAEAESVRVWRDDVLLATVRAGHGAFVDEYYSGVYEYSVAAGNRCGWSAPVTAAGTILPGTPLAPTALAASSDRCDMLIVRWEDNSNDEIAFEVRRDGERIGEAGENETSYIDRPAPGIHEYEVRAVGECGVTSGGFVTGSRLAPPLSPSLVSPREGALVDGMSPITLVWNAVSGAVHYRAQLSDRDDYAETLLDSIVPAPSTSLTLPFTPPPGGFYWRVAVTAECGDGGFSRSRYFTREAIGDFALSNRSVEFGHDPLGGPAGSNVPDPEPDPVVIRNDGERRFSWSVDPSEEWIGVDPFAGSLGAGEEETLWVRVLADGVASGRFDGQLYLHTDLPSRAEDTVRVDLTVKNYPLGDCNGNGDLDERDVAALADHVNGELPLWSPVLRLGLADIDFSRTVGEKDLERLPALIAASLLLEPRPVAGKGGSDGAVLWVGMSSDSFLVSLEGSGEMRAGAVRLHAAGSPEIVATPVAGREIRIAVAREEGDFVVVWCFPGGDRPALGAENRIDLFTLTWGDGSEPEMEFEWGGIAPSGSDRYPVSRAEWYRLGGPGSRKFAFFPIRPNPFADECLVSFELPATTPVALKVYDPAGRLVRTLTEGDHKPGFHIYPWDGRDHSGRRVGLGLYFVRLESSRGTIVRRSMIVR